MKKPSKPPYLHVRENEGSLFPFAVEISGNASALLQLRAQIGWALKDQDSYPLDDATYHDVHEEEFEWWARSREKMEPRGPKPAKKEERLPWAEKAQRSREG